MAFFYDTALTSEQRAAILSTPSYLVSPAELSKLLFAHFEDLDGAIAHLVRGIHDQDDDQDGDGADDETKERKEEPKETNEEPVKVSSYNDGYTAYTLL